MLGTYLNQTATLTRAQRRENGDVLTDQRAATLYEAPVTVACRIEPKTQEVLTADKRVVKTSSVFYLVEAVQEGDRLNGKLVEAVAAWTDFSGDTVGFEAVV